MDQKTEAVERRSGSDRRNQPFDIVEKPQHYNSHPSGIEAIDVCRFMSFDLGNAFKYIFRAPFKGSQLQDLKKARWYINDAITHLQEQNFTLPADTMYLVGQPFNERLRAVLMIIVTASHHQARLEFALKLMDEEIAELSFPKVDPTVSGRYCGQPCHGGEDWCGKPPGHSGPCE